ncbi:MAG TPA: YbhB/YbcL family Raf kinase inhibitor-like protein [Verrucomicrobiae bacterium]|jgi:Raf kinase inhibitor-like YbhB/YbcL family protein|nr:YbhB/YbcL family Raf kinase inhibitor-like protein [Verrucomicrobiae bacterium]
MNITSPVFQNQAAIPREFTGEGRDQSPPLDIADVPKDAKSLALVVDDPDAPGGNFTHWVLFNLKPSQTHLEPHVQPMPVLQSGARQGVNDFKRVGYGGPMPPSGKHHYIFHVYALDRELPIPEQAITRQRLLDEMKGHILAEAKLVGTYEKDGKPGDWKVDESSQESFPASDPPASY